MKSQVIGMVKNLAKLRDIIISYTVSVVHSDKKCFPDKNVY